MAMYENEGSCPNNSFLRYVMQKNPKNVEPIFDILGSRTGYMVYDDTMMAADGDYPSIVELLLNDTHGEQVAYTLRRMIPECRYAEVGKKILIKDVVNPSQIPGLYVLQGNDYSFKNSRGELNIYYPVYSENEGKRVLYYSNKFVTVIEDESDKVVIWIYKNPDPILF